MDRRYFLAAAATSASAAWAQSVGPVRGPKIGLALGAGAARGFSHIGVLKALDQAGIKADMVAGTSAGSLVGVFYAAGYSPWQMEEVALKVRDIDVADMATASKRGMFAGEALQKLVNAYVKGVPIEQLKIPFAAIATDLHNGDTVLLRAGDAGQAVRASCSIPGVFVPSLVNGRELVDGGLVSPLPVHAARQLGADFVLAVDVGAKPQNPVNSGLYEVLLQSFEVMGRALTLAESQQADFVVRPENARFSSTDFSVRKDLIQSGYEAMQAAMPRLKAALASPRVKRKTSS